MEGGTRPAGWETWQQRLRAGPSSVPAEFVVPSDPTGWVVVARPATALDGPSVDLTITELGGARLATMVVDLPRSDLATLAGWVNVAATHLRADRAEGLPIAYLGTGTAAAAGWAAALSGEINGVMGWNARPSRAWAHLSSVQVPSLLVVDEQAPWLRLLAHASRWRLGHGADVLTGVPVDDVGILSSWYRDRLLRPARPAPRRQPAAARRRIASVGVAAALGAAPGALLASTVAARPALAAGLPDFSGGTRLTAADIGGDGQAGAGSSSASGSEPSDGMHLSAADIDGDDKATGPRGDPPIVDGIGLRWNVNTNIGFTTTSSASGAASEASFTHPVAATTFGGGTVNATLIDAFDGYNALCVDLNNVGGQCNTANMAVYNQNGPASLECSNRQVVLPQRTIGNFQVRRKVFVPANDGFARWLNIFRNTSGAPQTVRLVTSNNLGSDANTRIVTTSDGDATPELSDTWVTTFQNFSGTTSTDVRLGHVLRGLGAPVGLAAISFANGDDNPFWRYQFTLAPGQTGIIMNFATGQASRAAAATESAGLAALSNANALACMTPAEHEQVVNFVTGSPAHGIQASAGGPLGTAVSATSTLTGFSNPTGTMTFNLYGPNDNTCVGAPVFTQGVPVNGNGIYNSPSHAPVAVGTYIWTAAYSGDGINSPSTTPCNSATASVVITPAGPATPTISTQASAGGPVGTSVNDVATVSGGSSPTGNVTFRLFTDAACTNQVFTTTNALAGGTATSGNFIPAAPGTYFWTAVYNGDANNNPATSPCGAPNESVVITSSTPTISTQASAGGPVGTSVNDVATVSGGSSPTGNVTFRLFTDAACTNQVFTTTNALAGGTATSGNFIPAAPGTYFWTAVYNGDANNNPATSPCGAPNESVTIVQGSPTISTQASAGGPVGTSVNDVATVSGGSSPTGNVTFRLFTDAACTNQVFTTTNALAGGTATSGNFIPAAPGTYFWTAVYNGDANNNPATSPCGAPNESVTIVQVPPTITTQASSGAQVTATGPSASISDTATLAGGVNPTGTITFRVYGPNDVACAGAPVFTDAQAVNGNGAYTSNSYTTAVLGTYRWVVDYSGDANNLPASSPCNAPNETSEVSPVCATPPPPGTLPGNTIVIAAPGLTTIGTPGNDVIYGTAGNDFVDGRGGDDVIFGQGGNDQLTGGDGRDTVCGGDGNDRLFGSAGNDLLDGGDGDDDMAGGDGDDFLVGGPGLNRLAGGLGTNTCIPGSNPGSQTAQCQIVPAVAADFGDDFITDVSLMRPSSGTWFVQDAEPVAWGTSGDIAVPGDYDGDGTADAAVFRPDTGTWFIQGGPTVAWGASGDVPVPGDYDGDGITDIAVFRPDTGTWFIHDGPTVAWGTASDVPVPGDYDGDGSTDIAVFRPDTGTWFIQDGPTVVWGTAGDVPVPGDYDGEGRTEIAVFRPDTGTWFVQGGPTVAWGISGDVPVPGDYDGDRTTDIAVFRPSNGTWYVLGGLSTNFGATGDQPLPLPAAIRSAFF